MWARTVVSSGRTVVFSACTVAAALSSLFVFQDATMRSLGIAGILVVLACMSAALTLMPALLGRYGHRLGSGVPASDHGWFAHVARLISRRAGLVVVLVSGFFEILGGVGLLVPKPRIRFLAAIGLIALYVAVFPANINMVRLWKDNPLFMRLGAIARLPLQIPMITAALKIYRNS